MSFETNALPVSLPCSQILHRGCTHWQNSRDPHDILFLWPSLRHRQSTQSCSGTLTNVGGRGGPAVGTLRDGAGWTLENGKWMALFKGTIVVGDLPGSAKSASMVQVKAERPRGEWVVRCLLLLLFLLFGILLSFPLFI